MAEQIDVVTPPPVLPTKWAPFRITIDTDEWSIELRCRADNGQERSEIARNLQAEIRALNKANLTNNSLLKRVMTYFINNGYFPGAIGVSGVPD